MLIQCYLSSLTSSRRLSAPPLINKSAEVLIGTCIGAATHQQVSGSPHRHVYRRRHSSTGQLKSSSARVSAPPLINKSAEVLIGTCIGAATHQQVSGSPHRHVYRRRHSSTSQLKSSSARVSAPPLINKSAEVLIGTCIGAATHQQVSGSPHRHVYRRRHSSADLLMSGGADTRADEDCRWLVDEWRRRYTCRWGLPLTCWWVAAPIHVPMRTAADLLMSGGADTRADEDFRWLVDEWRRRYTCRWGLQLTCWWVAGADTRADEDCRWLVDELRRRYTYRWGLPLTCWWVAAPIHVPMRTLADLLMSGGADTRADEDCRWLVDEWRRRYTCRWGPPLTCWWVAAPKVCEMKLNLKDNTGWASEGRGVAC